MKIALFGFGKMGKMVAQIAEAHGHQITPNLQEAETCIDFSTPESVINHIHQACAASIPLIIGTTGWESELPAARELIINSANAALYSPNFSLGIALFRQLLKKAQTILDGYEIAGLEFHHKDKKDAPSGTAKAIANDLKLQQPFSSVRCGSMIGKHDVLFDSPFDTITLTHEAKNREGFALGAVKAAEWIKTRKGWFTLDDMLHSLNYSI